jgi:hypothetical protein
MPYIFSNLVSLALVGRRKATKQRLQGEGVSLDVHGIRERVLPAPRIDVHIGVQPFNTAISDPGVLGHVADETLDTPG